MTAICVRGLATLRPLFWLAAILTVATVASRAIAAEPIVVRLDEARILKLPDRATTVVIGNPLIADLAIQPGGLAVVTGKSFGATNVLILDKSGAVLTEQNFEVEGPGDPVVVVYRGVDRNTYSCQPTCQPRLTLGDEQKYFNDTLTEISSRNNQSLSAGAGK
jgi:putative type II/III system pilus formation protein